MKFIITVVVLLICLESKAQCEDFIPQDTVYIGPDREIKNPQVYFDSTRSNVIVYLDSGHYYIDDTFFWVRGDHIIVEGIGRVSLYATELYTNVMWVIGDHIKIKHIHMKHFKPGGMESQNCSGRVVGFDNAVNVTIEDCDLNGCGLAGLHDNLGNENILIKDNYIHNNSAGAYTDIDGGVWQEAIDTHAVFTFENNRIENNGPNRIYEADTLTIDLLDSMEFVGLDSVITQWSQNGFGSCVPMFYKGIEDCDLCFLNDYEIIISTDGWGKTKIRHFVNDKMACESNEVFEMFKSCFTEMIEYDWVFDDHLRFKTIRLKLGDWLNCE